MARIARKTIAAAAPEPGAVRQWLKELVGAKSQQRVLKSRQDDLTKRLKGVVEETGYTDSDGHTWFDLDEPVEVDGKVYKQLQMQRKVSAPLNQERAEETLRKAGLFDECTTTITVLDQDAIMAAHYDGKLSEAQIEAMFPKKIDYALLTPVVK